MKIFLDKQQRDSLKERPWLGWFQTYRYSLLFGALLSQFLFMPFLEDKLRIFVPLLFFLIVITVLLTLDLRKSVFMASLAVGLLATLLHMLGHALDVTAGEETYFVLFGLSLDVIFLVFVIWVLVVKIFSEDKVTGETIKGGISVYFLLGLLWAYLYSLILIIAPDAISFPVSRPELSSIVYFSFTTLTTLGYGDITPAVWSARNLTILESTIGQIFLTVLIARLVGLHLAHKSMPACDPVENK